MSPPGSSPFDANDVTALLAKAGEGDKDASARLFPFIYDELHRLATVYMKGERSDHTLQPTALVHEAYLRLIGPPIDSNHNIADQAKYESRNHFIAVAALAMRRILINHAHKKKTLKRSGADNIAPTRSHDAANDCLDAAAVDFEKHAIDLLALDDALNKLALRDPTQAKIVELRYFGGMTVDDCAQLLNISSRTVHYEWTHARAWLRHELEGG